MVGQTTMGCPEILDIPDNPVRLLASFSRVFFVPYFFAAASPPPAALAASLAACLALIISASLPVKQNIKKENG